MATFLALLGFFGLILMVVLLLYNKTTPQVTFILISSLIGFLLVGMDYFALFDVKVGEVLNIKSGVFGFKELADFVKKGISSVAPTAALFIFSILFFTIMGVANVFNRIINAIIRYSKMNGPYSIAIVTVIVAVIAHLDGTGASTFLIAIPALLPIYEKFNMRITTLLLLTTASMGVMNLLPWGGPTLRVASVLGTDAMDLYLKLVPMQIVGLVLAFVLALIMGSIENRRIIRLGLSHSGTEGGHEIESADKEFARDDMFVWNILLALFVFLVLFVTPLPSYFPFMIGSAIALVMNYPQVKIQEKVVKKASSAAIMMATTLLAAGILIGVFDKSGIMKIMAQMIMGSMPDSIGTYLIIIIGVLAVPMAIIFCTDSYFYGILPIVVSVASKFNIDPAAVGIVMVVCRNCATFISPVVPATLLGCGLSGVSIKEHIKTSFFWIWGISIICLISGIVLGIVQI